MDLAALQNIYVMVSTSGQLQIRSAQNNTILQTLGTDFVSGVLTGDRIVAQKKNGKTYIYKLQRNGKSALLVQVLESTLEYHDKLNPKLWVGNELKANVRLKLLEIARQWAKFSLIPLRSIKDIIITGGNVNYNYTPYSDIDLHLIVDKSRIDNCPRLLDEYLRDKKQLWALTHDITIFGLPVELYAEDMNQVGQSKDRGVYSIKRNEWVTMPTHKKVNLSDPLTKKKLDDMIDYIKYLLETKSDDISAFKQLKNKIAQMRMAGISSGGEFGPENLVFKELRNLGYLDKISKHIRKLEDQSLSLEHYEY